MDKSLYKLLGIVVYLLIQYIVRRAKATTTHQPDDDAADQADHWPVPEPAPQPLPTPIPPVTLSSQERPLPLTQATTHRKIMVTPPYPGIKKLVLPTQEQDPYRLYQATSPQRAQPLARLLSKYNTGQQAIVMQEVLRNDQCPHCK